MPKLEKFEIEFENNSLSIFYAGTSVKGKVIIILNEPMKMRGVRLTFDGGARTNWSETKTIAGKDRNLEITDYYTGTESYFHDEITLWGNQRGSNDESPILPPGEHRFDFSYPIPIDCPCSFEGEWGHIRYVVDARIDRPWKFDHKTKRPLTVLGLSDLNTLRKADEVEQIFKEKNLGCCCCRAGQINCQLKLPKTGYVAGEIIAARVDVSNNSSRNLTRTQIKLIQRICFYASFEGNTKSKTCEIILSTLTKPNVEPRKSRVWSEEIPLPPCPLTLMRKCKIINISYRIEVKVTPSGPSYSLVLELPFTIGSVPLRREIPRLRQNYRQFSIEHENRDESSPTVQPSAPPGSEAYPELPPPTYMEATSKRISIKDESDNQFTKGQLEYTPRYAYFNWATAPLDEQ